MIDIENSKNAYDFPLLVKYILTSAVRGAPQQQIIADDGRSMSYCEFDGHLKRLARGLENLGVKQGDTVAVMNWDTPRYLACFFAVPMMGAVLHTINVRLSPEQILYTINHAEGDVILVHRDFVPIIEAIAAGFTRKIKLVLIDDEATNEALPDGFVSDYGSLVDNATEDYLFPDFDERTRATTFYTTGTVGDPKGVYYSHRQLVLHTLGVIGTFSPAADAVRLSQADVYMPMTPLFHVHAWGLPYAATLLGLKQVYPGRYLPEKLVALITNQKVTFSHCVPTIVKMIVDSAKQSNSDLSKIKIIVGGSALPQGLLQQALDMGIQMYAGYGLSETCPLLTTTASSILDVDDKSSHALQNRTKAGKPILLVELRIVNDDMQDLPVNEVGEIVVRAPWLTQGYLKNPETSDQLWQDGYLHTGDIGYLDETGSLIITDRIKDVIKSGGEWISSLLLENIASKVDGVEEAAAVGIADERWGERPLLLLVAKQPEVAARVQQAFQQQIDSGHISKWAKPSTIEIIASLPKTSVGKLDKKAIRQQHAK